MTECGLTNLATCLPEMFFQYIADILNSAIEPLLHFVQSLLTAPASVDIFFSLWAVIIYVISLFYGLFFLIAGFNFMVSGYDSAKREAAKSWLRNVVLMIIFVQASFLIYSLIIEMSSLMTAGMISAIDPNFFLMTSDNITNFGLQFSLISIYIIVLLLTVILLGLRYLFVIIGVVFFPFALFFYFIPPLQSYGKMILNILMVLIFVPFFDAVLLFGASALMDIPLFTNFKIVVITMAFLSINLLMTLLLLFAIIKAAFGVLNSDVGKGVKTAVKYFV